MNELLTENEVVEIMMSYLNSQGYTIESYATTTQKGIDIEAFKDGNKICIEAKGATSSLKNSARYGKPFQLEKCETIETVLVRHQSLIPFFSCIKNRRSETNDSNRK